MAFPAVHVGDGPLKLLEAQFLIGDIVGTEVPPPVCALEEQGVGMGGVEVVCIEELKKDDFGAVVGNVWVLRKESERRKGEGGSGRRSRDLLPLISRGGFYEYQRGSCGSLEIWTRVGRWMITRSTRE